MTNQVIGLFDDRAQAERVKEDLVSAGFNRSNINIYAHSGAAGTTATTQEPGVWERIKEAFGFADEEDRYVYAEATRRGAIAVSVETDNQAQVDRAAQIMQAHNAIDLDRRVQEWRGQGWQGYQKPAATGQKGSEQVIPVTQEELRVGKRQVQGGGVRIYSRVTEKPVEEKVTLREERVKVERTPTNRPVQPGDRPFEERTIEATETSEEAVANKQARVVEEVRVRKDVQEKTETVHDTVRRTDVEVEKLGPGEESQLADTYAQELARDERYRGRDWNTIETSARSDFERRYPGRTWDKFKGAVSRGYERMRQKA